MNWFFLVVGSILVIVALLLTILEIRGRLCWRAATGSILSTRIEKQFDEAGKKVVLFWVEYRYRVEGVGSFTGQDAIEFSPSYHEEDDAIRRLEEEYGHGTSIEVYHGPNRPELSSLSRGIGLLKYLQSILTLLVILVGYYVYYNVRISDVAQ